VTSSKGLSKSSQPRSRPTPRNSSRLLGKPALTSSSATSRAFSKAAPGFPNAKIPKPAFDEPSDCALSLNLGFQGDATDARPAGFPAPHRSTFRRSPRTSFTGRDVVYDLSGRKDFCPVRPPFPPTFAFPFISFLEMSLFKGLRKRIRPSLPPFARDEAPECARAPSGLVGRPAGP